MAAKLIPVVLSGGSGTRLWPLSRASYPKQFLPLHGDGSLIQQTIARARTATDEPPIVVCSAEHRFLVAEQLRALGIAVGEGGARVVLEPLARNTAPAVAVAALLAAERDPAAQMLVLAADHAIADVPGFAAAIDTASEIAGQGNLVTFGMQPDRPETGYGYIRKGEALAGQAPAGQAFKVAAFVEKPDAATAARYVSEGYLWNSGSFLFPAQLVLDELAAHAPAVLDAARNAVAGATRDLDFFRLDEAAFSAAPSISIDYAVMETTSCAAVVPAAIGWSDIGSFDALWAVGAKDAAGNVTIGDALVLDSRNSFVRSDGLLTAVLGLDDVVVVTSDDAVLVTSRDRAQDVKKVVDALKVRGRKEGTEHRRVYRPWGFYEGLILGERFQVKRIQVTPGAKLSLQKHFHRAEHWVVVKGTAIVTRDAETLMVRETESVYLPLGSVHRMENPGKIPLVLIEVQVGSYTGEDDIVRIEDTYGRV
jgi:mannose-1-phosphate guanylyltransferase/mannose-1-phosphate guanylyltransferase/mannose-6-phosphate isomerase